jgi:hypothetical protein
VATKKEAWSDTLILIGGRRKNHAHEYRDNSPRDIRVEPLCGLCVLIENFLRFQPRDKHNASIFQNVRQALRIVVANVGIIFEKCVVTGDFLIVFSSLGLGMKGKILASIRLSRWNIVR